MIKSCLDGNGRQVTKAVDFFIFFFLYQSTVEASRLMEAQMNLPRLLFGIGFFRFFIVTPQMFTFSLEYVENV